VLDAALPSTPHVHYARRDARGYVSFRLFPHRLDARLRVISDAANPGHRHNRRDVPRRSRPARGAARVEEQMERFQ